MGLLLFLFLQAGVHQAGLEAYKAHHYGDAVQRFSEAVKTESPGSPEYQESVLLLGQSLYSQGKFAGAIPWLEKAAASGLHPLEAGYMLGNACLHLQQEEKAAKAFAGVFRVAPDSAAAHMVTAQMMMHQEMERSAEKEARRALEIDPHIAQAHFLIGEVALYLGELDRALAEFQKEIEKDPNFATAYYRLGDAYSRRDAWEQAIPLLEQAIWLNPNYSGPYILLGKGYLARQNLPDAEGVLRHALELDPQNRSAHYLLGQTLMRSGKTEEGKQELARWRELPAR